MVDLLQMIGLWTLSISTATETMHVRDAGIIVGLRALGATSRS